ncbi:regulatory protein, luxR family [Desulfonatronum zhilinae]|nr:regulatory protein, luxR family [Desulfonatronum zhilinae]
MKNPPSFIDELRDDVDPAYPTWDQDTKVVYLERRFVMLNQQLAKQERLAETRICLYNTAQHELEEAMAKIQSQNVRLRKMGQRLARAKKKLEQEVRKRTKELEQKHASLMEHARKLEQANTALDVLVQKHERDRKVLAQNVINHWRGEIMPLLERLRMLSSNDEQRILVDTTISQLLLHSSGCHQASNSICSCLSEREHEVALLIADGRTSKEVARLLRITLRCVQSHCYSIRRKLNLAREVRLKTYLQKTLLS